MTATPIQPSFQNTLGRRHEALETVEPGTVRLYTCGPTVYGHAHIGNLRTFVFEDILRRSLEYLGYSVFQVMNLTDIDDKTIARAAQEGVSLAEYTEPFIQSFFADLRTLHVELAEEYPKATDHVAEMIELVEKLVEKGYAYESEGSIFFRIAQDEDYGRLSGFDLDEVRQGTRVADDEYDKEDARDFVLWKAAKPGEPSWDSPWGPGRPGWHLECSAMSMKYLGETFDIHCGGVDNIFPHHENEIAQSESATGKLFARHWLHSEHLIVDGEKMSKSLGNFYTLKELLEKGAKARAVRYLFLSVHYRKKLNFTFGSLDDATTALKRIDQMRFALDHAVEKELGAGTATDPDKGSVGPPCPTSDPIALPSTTSDAPTPQPPPVVLSEAKNPLTSASDTAPDLPQPIAAATEHLRSDFAAALADDLNLSKALATIFDFVRAVNKVIEAGNLVTGDRARVLETLADVDQVLGVLDPADWVDESGEEAPANGALSDADIEALIQERKDARAAKNFARADEIRDQFAEAGIVLEDTPDGTRWKRE